MKNLFLQILVIYSAAQGSEPNRCWRRSRSENGPGFEFYRLSNCTRIRNGKRVLWCPGPDSNRHGGFRRRGILSPLCLPVSPPGRIAILAVRARAEGSHAPGGDSDYSRFLGPCPDRVGRPSAARCQNPALAEITTP